MTIETLIARVNTLEEQVGKLEAFVYMASENVANTSSEKVDKKPKKSKKEKPVSDDEKPKKVSGYILYSKAKREEAIANIKTENGDEDYKPKSTEVMKELGRMWKELDDSDRVEWNATAKEACANN